MSQFTATKCDECGRIKGEANHWLTLQTWEHGDAHRCDHIVALGNKSELLMGTSDITGSRRVEHDLCGQACAMKHLAALLKWNVPAETA